LQTTFNYITFTHYLSRQNFEKIITKIIFIYIESGIITGYIIDNFKSKASQTMNDFWCCHQLHFSDA